MARILVYTSPARGHLYPAAAIMAELNRDGHQVSVRTLASEVSLMQSRGFKAGAIRPEVEAIQHDDFRARSPQAALGHAVRVFGARAEFDGPDLRQAIEDERPEALLVDINSWGALAAAEAWGGPWAAFCPYPLALRSRDVPPFGPGLAPAHGFLGRLRDRALRPLVLGTIEKAMLPPLQSVRHQLGLPSLAAVDEMFLRPPLILYMTAEPFEYQRSDWPPNIVMVGPCEWEPDADPPGWLAEITQPIVLVTTSSEFQDDGRLVQAALEGLAGEPFTVIATVPAGTPGQFHARANARVEGFVPHGPVLDRAVCAVTHGGMGATQKALARGVPVCAVPFGRDQLEVARRVEVAEAGTRLPAKRLTPERLRQKVREAMTKVEGAKRVAAGFSVAGGATAAAHAFESRLLTAARLPQAAEKGGAPLTLGQPGNV